ncbi:MAG: HD-GYP domain-containing protein [Solirubrobacterales bacterium]|nr:HD-GYP domain-containing protein [Solirubrobacterales bacterium]
MKDDALVPGGYLLHSYDARTLAARLATVHTFVIGAVVAVVAIDSNKFDPVTIAFLVGLCLWAPMIPLIPWGRYSHNVLAKIYFLGAGTFVFFAYYFDNPYLLLGIYPELFAFADIYWYRRSLVALHLGGLIAVFIASAILIGGEGTDALVLIAAPLMTASAVFVGAMSHRFVQAALQHRQFQSAVDSLLAALQARDGYTGDHSKVTLAMATAVAEELNLDAEARKELADVALLHDIGKLGIPNSILQKPGALTDEEWETMRQHPVIGEQILAGVPGFESIAKAVRHEHERWDGGGYPDGIAGEEIPMASRIVLTCDAFHAMTSDRPYRAAMSIDDARAELQQHAGTQFDPEIVAAFDRTIQSGAFDSVPEIDASSPPDELATLRKPSTSVPFEMSSSEAERPARLTTLDDPKALITASCLNAALIALAMSTYLVVAGEFDWVGWGFVGLQVALAATGAALRGRTPRTWCFFAALSAYLLVPVVAFHYQQPAMIALLLGSAVLLSGFFWRHIALRIFQVFLLAFEFIVLPVLLFGNGSVSFAAASARAFPGSLLIVGYFTMRLAEMHFERQRFTGTMNSLLLALQARDGYTADHSRETVTMATQVGQKLGLSEPELLELKDVALLHDIGKLGIPDEILNKPGPLDDVEWNLMRQHPVIGEQIICRVPGFESVALGIRHEHERWDGGGYPDGLSGNDIPLTSRIVFACDAYHAMTSDRPYRESLAEAAGRAEMTLHAGTQFDPEVVVALLSVLDRLQEAQHSIETARLAA